MSRFVQASFDTPSASLIVNRTIIGGGHIVFIQKRGFGGVAFVLMDDLYTKFFGFGSKLLFEFVVGYGDKVLVVCLADVDALLATAEVAKYDGSYVVLEGILYDMLNGKIEEVANAVVSSLTQGYEVVGMFVSLPIVDGLQVGFALVEVAVDGFDIAPVYDKSATATWITSRKVIYAKVDGKIAPVFLWLLYRNLINKFDMPHLASKAWNEAKLLELLDMLHMLWKLEAKLIDTQAKLFGKSGLDGDYHVAVFDSCAPALYGDAHKKRLLALSIFLVVWQAYLVAIFALFFELQKSKEAAHIPVDKPHDALGYVAQEHLVVGRGFDSMVVGSVVQILAVLEVVLTHAIQRLIVEPCAGKTHSFDSLHLGGFESEAVSLCAYSFHTHIILKLNERR